jgi:hypothetical protein
MMTCSGGAVLLDVRLVNKYEASLAAGCLNSLMSGIFCLNFFAWVAGNHIRVYT